MSYATPGISGNDTCKYLVVIKNPFPENCYHEYFLDGTFVADGTFLLWFIMMTFSDVFHQKAWNIKKKKLLKHTSVVFDGC